MKRATRGLDKGMVFAFRPELPRAGADWCGQILTFDRGARLMRRHRLLACAVTALAILIAVPAALAATSAHHSRQVHGRVIAINARHHTLRLRVLHAKRASTASAGGGQGLVVSFGDAKVSGPNGAISVGDDVVVTESGDGSGTPVATQIKVIGQANGGDAGKGAAIPGEVTGVDASAATLTLAVLGTDSQGNTQMTSLIVNVSSSTILAVSDTNGDGKITVADIQTGDHVIVFTADATANPVDAVGILDASHSGGDHQGNGGGDGPQPTPIPGTVTTVGGSDLMINVTDGPMSGQALDVKVTPQTSYGGEDGNGDGNFGLSDITTGDSVVVYTPDPTPGSVVAVGVVDRTSHSSAPQYAAFNGTVTAPVGPSSAQVLVTGDGPLGGQTVTVQVTSTTHYKGQNASGGQVTTLADVQPGDIVSVYVLGSLSTTPIVAAYFADRGTGTSSDPPSPTSPPAPPAPTTTPLARFGGTVTDVRGDGLTVTVTSGGPLQGQSVIVAIGPNVSFKTSDGTGSGQANLQYISVGDLVEIFPASTSGTAPVVAVGVVDDTVPTG